MNLSIGGRGARSQERGTRGRKSVGDYAGTIVVGLVITTLLIWTLIPYYFAFVSSIKDPADNYGDSLIP